MRCFQRSHSAGADGQLPSSSGVHRTGTRVARPDRSTRALAALGEPEDGNDRSDSVLGTSVTMSEAIAIRLRRARSWLRKATKAGQNGDVDAQFVFLWIAFNALYGTPRYRRSHDETYVGETEDFLAFLGESERLSRGRFETCLGSVESHVQELLWSPFLNIECWRHWDKAGIRDRQKRRASSCNTYDKAHRIGRVFLQLYTLRNQVLHGAATDEGQRNRESLKHAIPILDVFVPACIDLVAEHGTKIRNLDPIPFPPSHGDDGQFNSPRLKAKT